MNNYKILQSDIFIAEKKQWVSVYGSDTLRVALDNGYDSNICYFEERIAVEYPGFSVIRIDNANDSTTDDRSEENRSPFPFCSLQNPTKVDSPSSSALKESLKYPNSYVASLVDVPLRLDPPREILVVDRYLGVCQIGKFTKIEDENQCAFEALRQDPLKWGVLLPTLFLLSINLGISLSCLIPRVILLPALSLLSTDIEFISEPMNFKPIIRKIISGF